MRPADDPSWDSYPDTILELFRDTDDEEPALRVDLRRPVARDLGERLAELGLTRPFAVITAAAPKGDAVHDAFDAARQAELEEEARLAAMGPVRRVDGVSPDGEHRERSLAIPIARDDAVALGRRWQQSAIFWWDGERFWLVGAVVEAEAVALPRGRSDGGASAGGAASATTA